MDQEAVEPARDVGESSDSSAPGVRTGAADRPPMDYEPTGVGAVDRVLAEVATIADAPVGDHVAVFERAHEQLRRALDAPTDEDPGAGADEQDA